MIPAIPLELGIIEDFYFCHPPEIYVLIKETSIHVFGHVPCTCLPLIWHQDISKIGTCHLSDFAFTKFNVRLGKLQAALLDKSHKAVCISRVAHEPSMNLFQTLVTSAVINASIWALKSLDQKWHEFHRTEAPRAVKTIILHWLVDTYDVIWGCPWETNQWQWLKSIPVTGLWSWPQVCQLKTPPWKRSHR